MDRKDLKKYIGKRLRFTACVEKFGEKPAYRGYPIPTILLKNIKLVDCEEILTDHLWFTFGKTFGRCNIGDTVEFDARVSTYEKGYKGYRDDVFDKPVYRDYRLERPTKLEVI
jgi:hypothetical protein